MVEENPNKYKFLIYIKSDNVFLNEIKSVIDERLLEK